MSISQHTGFSKLSMQIQAATAGVSVITVLGLAIAIIMPVAEAAIYPTYMHTMRLAWIEWTRLQEIPYVLFEAVVIAFAVRRGMTLRLAWKGLSHDVRLALLALVIGIFVGSIFTSNLPAFTVAASCISIVNLLFALAAAHLLGQSRNSSVAMLMPLMVCGLVILSCYTALRFAFPPPTHLVWGGVIEWPSAIPGFISVRHFGSWSGAIAAGMGVQILFGAKSGRFELSHLFYFIAAAVTVWTGTRAAILAMIVIFLITCISLRRLPTPDAIGRAALLTGAALTAAYILLPADPTFRLINAGDYSTLQGATALRDRLWELTFLRWLDSPWFGWGTGSTFWEVDIGWPHTQPHNAVLQFLISWGVVGTAGALYLIGKAIRRVHAPGMTNAELRPLLAMLYALLFQSLLEGMLHYPRFINAIIFLFVVIVIRSRSPASSRPHNTTWAA